MGGAKLGLLKQTLRLLCSNAGLTSGDKFGLVSFATDARADLPLCTMDSSGLRKAQRAVDALKADGGTNLSAGLLTGLDALVRSAGGGEGDQAAMPATATRVCLVFTDGHANHGVTRNDALVAAAQGCMRGSPTAIFTFGFGGDHNEDVLIALSRAGASGGQYYHITSAEAIPSAFADCLGGLVSVVAQTATLELRAIGGATLGRVLGDAYSSTVGVDGVTRIHIGDLYAEDEKDLLLELRLPALAAATPEEVPEAAEEPDAWAAENGWTMVGEAPGLRFASAHPACAPVVAGASVVEAKLRYFSVEGSVIDEVAAELAVARPENDTDALPDIALDEQHNRVLVVEALQRAVAVADGGDLAGGKALLDEVAAKLGASASASSDVSRALVEDVRRLAIDYERHEVYASVGSKRSKGSAMSHSYQRSTHDTPVEIAARSYKGGGSGKSSMKRSWGTI